MVETILNLKDYMIVTDLKRFMKLKMERYGIKQGK